MIHSFVKFVSNRLNCDALIVPNINIQSTVPKCAKNLTGGNIKNSVGPTNDEYCSIIVLYMYILQQLPPNKCDSSILYYIFFQNQ